MPLILKAILIYAASFVLGIIFNGPLGKLYRYFEGPYKGTSLGIIFGETTSNFLAGFMFSYFLFLGILLALLIKKMNNVIIIWLIGILYFVLTSVLMNEWQFFVYLVLFSILGFLLGKLILLIRKKIK